MVRLNKHQLPKDQLDKLFSQLNKTLGNLSTSQTDLFLTELLGEEERIMLAKRLAVAVMVQEGYSLYRISNTLKVSPATAEKIKESIERNEYQHILSVLKKDKANYAIILEVIESILTVGGIMPRYGKVRLK